MNNQSVFMFQLRLLSEGEKKLFFIQLFGNMNYKVFKLKYKMNKVKSIGVLYIIIKQKFYIFM